MTTLLCATLIGSAVSNAQDELTPEPGVLAEADRYYLKLRKAFSEAYEPGVDLRVIVMTSFFPETAAFIDKNNHLVTLTPKKHSIWSHEHRGMVREGEIGRTDINGRKIPPTEEDEATKRIPEKVEDISMIRRSKPLPKSILIPLQEVWKDALLHTKHPKAPTGGLDGVIWHYSAWIKGRGVLSGSAWSPDSPSIPSALNDITDTLIDYNADEANETHVAEAIWNYKLATKSRRGGMTDITIEKPAKIIPVPFSVHLAGHTILDQYEATNISLNEALEKLTKASSELGKKFKHEGISFSADKQLGKIKVTYTSKGENMKRICESLAEQVGARIKYGDASVELLKKADK